jgi:putative ABC transport system substrate-binding protein
MNNRRKLVVALGACALAAPFACLAQKQKVWRIGILDPGSRPVAGDIDLFDAFLKGLRELGYAEGRNVTIERRYADGKLEPLLKAAAEIVKLNVDVIVTVGTQGVRAAQGATKNIPIVTTSFADPVGSGFAASLSRPGGNITGMANMSEDIDAKRLELLMSVVSKVSRVGKLLNPDNAAVMRMLPALLAVAQKAGKTIVVVKARTVDDIVEGFSVMAREHAGALLVSADVFLNGEDRRIANLALRYRLPSLFPNRQSVEAGGLMSYGIDYSDAYRRAATFVDKIFKGASPGHLPIEQPTKFELVINMKTAKTLGIKVPQSILLRADKVIE